jgi:MoaA/NifB/PqqE/SkfB family radical SAM enzyme
MTLDDAKLVLQKSLLKKLSYINFSGNYGDAIANKDFIPIIEYIRSVNPKIHLTLTTNGGARDTNFWIKIANLIDTCDFGIDGLRDTNHLYRQFVNWNILERNVIAYINESNRLKKQMHSIWTINVFKHNEHQVQDAKKLASQWGISKFRIRITNRFDTWSKPRINAWPVVDDNMNMTHVLYPVGSDEQIIIDPLMIKASIDKAKISEQKNGDILSKTDLEYLTNRHDNDDISCEASKRKSIYIDYLGRLFPCCYFASVFTYSNSSRPRQIIDIYSKYGENFNNLKKNTIESIFDSGIFEEIEDSWYKKDIKSGKNATCILFCAKNGPKCSIS